MRSEQSPTSKPNSYDNKTLDICYLYCTPVPESKGEFYSLPVVRVAKMFENTCTVQVHVHAIGDLDTTLLEEHDVCCHTTDRLFPRLGLFSLYVQLFIQVLRLGWRKDVDIVSNIWAHYHLLPVILAARLVGTSVLARVYGLGNAWARSDANCSLLSADGPSPQRVALVRLLNRLEAAILRLADRVYTDAKVVEDLLVDLRVPRSHINVISQGVDTKYFTPLADIRNETSDINQPTVLFVGRLASKAKRFEDAYAVVDTVRDDLPTVEFVVAGSGTSTVQSSIKQEEWVEMRGYLDRPSLRTAYREADLLLVTSEIEGVPNVVLEAMSCGLPVVATPAGDIPRLLESGGGVTVHSREIASLASVVVTLLTDEQQRSTCSKRAREYVVEEHSLTSLRARYLSLFESVL